MKKYINQYFPAVAVFSFAFLVVHSADATSVTYTFEQFSAGTTTPILNAPPDSGPASFQASFTSAPTANGFRVAFFQPNGLFSGNELVEPGGSGSNTLTISLNMAITSVSLVFATASFNGSNTLFFFSSSGNTSAASTPQSGGGGFDGGVLTFNSVLPFTSFSLNDGAAGPEFAIDNVVMNTANAIGTPDTGSTLTLLTLAIFSFIGLHRRFSNQLVSC